MLFLVFVALLVAFLVALVLAKRFAFGAFFISAGVFAMAGCAAAGGLFINPENPLSLRFVTLDETPPVAVRTGLQTHTFIAPIGLTAAGYRAKSISILVHRNDISELREHIKYELRRGNITADKATSLSVLIDELNREGNIAKLQLAALITAQPEALTDLGQWQARLNETLADTIKLVKVLDSARSAEFAGTFIAAKIQVVRLLAEKAVVDGSIDEIRQILKRPKAG
jgi:hypothetical protein